MKIYIRWTRDVAAILNVCVCVCGGGGGGVGQLSGEVTLKGKWIMYIMYKVSTFVFI